jgi:DNA mismatch endonuclease Vsr
MRGNVRAGTKPELQLRRLLRDAGFPGYRLHWKEAPGTPDIAYPGRKVAIFVNGCFWHRCPHCLPAMPKSHADFWERKFIRNRERDERKTTQLEAAGWRVVTVWECELRDDPMQILRRIKTELLWLSSPAVVNSPPARSRRLRETSECQRMIQTLDSQATPELR